MSLSSYQTERMSHNIFFVLVSLFFVRLSPLSAMVSMWHRVIVSSEVMAQKGLVGTLISWVKCIIERLTGVKTVL